MTSPQTTVPGPVVLELTVAGPAVDTQKVIDAALTAATAAALGSNVQLTIKFRQPECDTNSTLATPTTSTEASEGSTAVIHTLDNASGGPSTSTESSSGSAIVPAKRTRTPPTSPSKRQAINVVRPASPPAYSLPKWLTPDLVEDIDIVIKPLAAPSLESANCQRWSLSITYEPRSRFLNQPSGRFRVGGVIVGDNHKSVHPSSDPPVKAGIPLDIFKKIWSSIHTAAASRTHFVSDRKSEIMAKTDSDLAWVPVHLSHFPVPMLGNLSASALTGPTGPLSLRQFRRHNKNRHFVANIALRVYLVGTFVQGAQESGAQEWTVEFRLDEVDFVEWK